MNTTTKGMDAGGPADSRCQSVDVVRLYALLAMLFSHAADKMGYPLRLATGWDRAVPALDAWAVLPAVVLHLASPTFALLTGVSLAFYVAARARRAAPAAEIDGYLVRRGALLLALGYLVDGVRVNPIRVSSDPGILGMFGMALWLMVPARRLPAVGQFVAVAVVAAVVPPLRLGWGQSMFPVLPWFPVILLGFAAGRLVAERRVRLETLGWSLAAILAVLWATLWLVGYPLAFRKYPPSLGYLLPYLSLAFALLALHDRYRQPERWWPYRRLVVLARCSLFFYLVHSKLVLNALAVLLDPLDLPPALGIAVAGVLTVVVTLPLCRFVLRWTKAPRADAPAVTVPASAPSFP